MRQGLEAVRIVRRKGTRFKRLEVKFAHRPRLTTSGPMNRMWFIKGEQMHLKTAVFAIALACAAPAYSQAITAKDPGSIVSALQSKGYQAQLDKDKGGDPLIRSASSGSKFNVFFYNCTEGSDCATVQFYSGYETEDDATPSFEKINEWNRTKRFGRAYIDAEGEPVIEMDVDLDDGGMSQALFMDNVEFWTAVMAEFESYIGW